MYAADEQNWPSSCFSFVAFVLKLFCPASARLQMWTHGSMNARFGTRNSGLARMAQQNPIRFW